MRQRRIPLIHSRLFGRTWGYYLAGFWIPFFLLSVLLVSGAWALSYRDRAARLNESLSSVQREVQGALDNASKMGYNLMHHDTIIPVLLPENPDMQQELLRTLSNYRAVNPLYSAVLVYFPQVPTMLYSAYGAYAIETLSLFIPPDPDDQPYSRQLDALTAPVLLPAARPDTPFTYVLSGLSSRDILYILPLQRMIGHPYLTLLVQLDTARLRQIAQAAFSDWPGLLVLRNSGGRAVYTWGDATLPGDLEPDADEAESPLRPEREGVRYLLFHTAGNAQARLSYLLPESAMWLDIAADLRPLLYAVGAVGLLGTLWATYLAYRSYLPIARLNHSLQRTEAQFPARADELSDIAREVQAVLSEKREIGRQIEHVSQVIQGHTLRMLLDGRLGRQDALQPLLSTARLHLPGPQFVALCAVLPEDLSPEARQEIVADTQASIVWQPGPVYAVSQPDCLALVASLQGGLATRVREEHLVGAFRAILADYDLEVAVGVGNPCDCLYQLARSYQEARCVLRGESRSESPSVVFYADEQVLDSPPPRLTDRLTRLQQHIVKANEDAALRSLQEIWDTLAPGGEPSPLYALHFFRLLEALGQTLTQTGYWAEDGADNELAALLRIPTPAGQEAALRRLVHTASLAATQFQAAQGVDTLRALQDFIAQHAFDPLFNMDKLVEAFGQPPSTLSRLFKRHFGMNFIDYVSYLRMQKARELLTATDLKLKDIVQAIGYSDVANFIRKFRIQEGMTPGEYRKTHRASAST